MREAAGDEPIGMVAFDTLNQTLALTIDKFDENSSSTAIGMGKVIAILKKYATQLKPLWVSSTIRLRVERKPVVAGRCMPVLMWS
ncbi:hypothetical protein [Escherichia phage CR01]|nr:hypothetical protein [Escherichia phage CR01]